MDRYFVDRTWMYKRQHESRIGVSDDFQAGVEVFLKYAMSKAQYMDGNKIKCPCRNCRNRRYEEVVSVRDHLTRKGFVRDYDLWSSQGELYAERQVANAATYAFDDNAAADFVVDDDECSVDYGDVQNLARDMVYDAAGPNFDSEDPNPEAKEFYDMFQDAETSLYPGCEPHSILSVTMRC